MNKYEYRIKYEDTNLTFTNILNIYSKSHFIKHIVLAIIPFLQLHITNADITVFTLTYILKSLLFSPVTIVNQISIEYFHTYINNKEYYQLGNLARKLILIPIVLTITTYMPLSYIFYRLSGIESYSFYFINFFTLIAYSTNLPLCNLLHIFGKTKLLDLLTLIKLVSSLMFLISFNRKNYFYLNSIALSDFLSEAVILTIVFLLHKRLKPYPQAWVAFNSDALNYNIRFIKSISLQVILEYTISYCDQIMVLVYLIFYGVNDFLGKILFLLLIKDLFFNSQKFAGRIFPEENKDELTKKLLSDELDNNNYLLQRYFDLRMKANSILSAAGLLFLLILKLFGFIQICSLFRLFLICIIGVIQNTTLDFVQLKLYDLYYRQLMIMLLICLFEFIFMNWLGESAFFFFLYNFNFINFILKTI
jgi:hypothetical protein